MCAKFMNYEQVKINPFSILAILISYFAEKSPTDEV